MRNDARIRAERCFALARSTTFPAERNTAIETGTRIAQVAGEELDTFDIPGRARTSPRRAAARQRCAPLIVVLREDDLATALDRLRATMARQAAAAGAAPDETIHDARLRNFHRAAAEARARDAQREAA